MQKCKTYQIYMKERIRNMKINFTNMFFLHQSEFFYFFLIL